LTVTLFDSDRVRLDLLRQRAYNYRWAVHPADVIPLTAADPDFAVAPQITEALVRHVTDGYHSYGPPRGLPEFREAIANWYTRTKLSPVDPAHVLPVNSAAGGLFIAAQTILGPGDNAIIPDPVDFLFRRSIEAAGGTVRTCPLPEGSAEYDLEALASLIDDRTRAIFICNPHNPRGRMLSAAHLMALVTLAERHGLWIVSDEIWADISYTTPFVSILDRALPVYAKTIVVSGLSKNFALAAMRIGYLVARNPDVTQRLFNTSQHASTAAGIPVLSQVAGTAALSSCDAWLSDFRVHLAARREQTLAFIADMPFLAPVDTNATYLAFPRLVGVRDSAESFVARVLEESRVALVPGGRDWFEAGSEGHLRICFATSEDILKVAFDRITCALPTLAS
jgi:aminotransferase